MARDKKPILSSTQKGGVSSYLFTYGYFFTDVEWRDIRSRALREKMDLTEVIAALLMRWMREDS